jgi:hypothetical protein
MVRLNLQNLVGRSFAGCTTDMYDVLFENATFRPLLWSTDHARFRQEHGDKRGYKSSVPFWSLLEILSECKD